MKQTDNTKLQNSKNIFKIAIHEKPFKKVAG
jgi:hypothetical protein